MMEAPHTDQRSSYDAVICSRVDILSAQAAVQPLLEPTFQSEKTPDLYSGTTARSIRAICTTDTSMTSNPVQDLLPGLSSAVACFQTRFRFARKFPKQCV